MNKTLSQSMFEIFSKDFPTIMARKGKLLPESDSHHFIEKHLSEQSFMKVFDEMNQEYEKFPTADFIPSIYLNYANDLAAYRANIALDEENLTANLFLVSAGIQGNIEAFNKWLQDPSHHEVFSTLCQQYLAWSMGSPLTKVLSSDAVLSNEDVGQMDPEYRYAALLCFNYAIYNDDIGEISSFLEQNHDNLSYSTTGQVLIGGGYPKLISDLDKDELYMNFIQNQNDPDLQKQCAELWKKGLTEILPEEIQQQCQILPPKSLTITFMENLFYEFVQGMDAKNNNSIAWREEHDLFKIPLIPLTNIYSSINLNTKKFELSAIDIGQNNYSQNYPLYYLDNLEMGGFQKIFQEYANNVKSCMDLQQPDREIKQIPSPKITH